MLIEISKRSCVSDLKSQFGNYFPFLKLELFQAQSNPDRDELLPAEDETKLDKLNPFLKDGMFFVDTRATVAEFQSALLQQCNLYVEILRRVHSLWQPTLNKDQFSLQQQNDIGQITSRSPQFNNNRFYL